MGDPEAAYVHYCDNETVNWVEWGYTPDVGSVPLVADVSSNFCSRPIDVSKHAYIYAGIQKNLGPAGMAVGFIRPDFATGAHESSSAQRIAASRLLQTAGPCTTRLHASQSM